MLAPQDLTPDAVKEGVRIRVSDAVIQGPGLGRWAPSSVQALAPPQYFGVFSGNSPPLSETLPQHKNKNLLESQPTLSHGPFLLARLLSAVFLSLLFTCLLCAQDNALARLGALALGDVSETKVRSAVIDTANGFAYFGVGTPRGVKGKVLKIRLSDLARVDAITLNEGVPASAVIDAAGGFAYFGTDTSPGKIVKIRLSNFTRENALALNAGEDKLTSAVIDAAGGFAYFGTNTTPGKVVKINLSDFTREASLALNTGEDFLSSAVIDPAAGFAYFGSLTGGVGTSGGGVVKIRLSDFSRAGALPLVNLPFEAGLLGITSAVIDPAGGFAYFATYSGSGFGVNNGIVLKIRLSDFVEESRLVFELREGPLYSAVIDAANGFAYFGMDTGVGSASPAVRVAKVRLSDFSRVDTLTVGPGLVSLISAVIDPAGGFAYFGTNTNPGKIVKIRLKDFALADAPDLSIGEGRLLSGVMDSAGGFAYFGTDNSPGKVVKIRLSDFTRVGAVALNSGEDSLSSAVIDTAGGFAYFGTNTSPGKIVKIRLSDFTRVGTLTLETGENNLTSAVIDTVTVVVSQIPTIGPNSFRPSIVVTTTDKGFAYFGTNTSPGKVVKIRLSDFARVGAIALDSGEDSLSSAVIDPAGGFAYFGTNAFPAKVVKIRLSDFTRVGAHTFTVLSGLSVVGDAYVTSAAIDTAGGFAYFGFARVGTATAFPGRIAKINLSNFAVESIAEIEEQRLVSAVMDAGNGFAYFGTNTSPGKVVKIRLSDFVRVGTFTFTAGEDVLFSAVIDPAGGSAYFGTSTDPGRIVKMRLSDFARVGAVALDLGIRLPQKGELTLIKADSPLISAAIDEAGGFAYFGTADSPGRVLKIDLGNLTLKDALTLNAGENTLASAVIDKARGFVYFGTADLDNLSSGSISTHSYIVKIRLSDFTRTDALAISSTTGVGSLTTAVIDESGGFAYFGSRNGRALKINLQNFSVTKTIVMGARPLLSNQNGLLIASVGTTITPRPLFSSAIDPPRGFAFFGSDSGRVFVADLRDHYGKGAAFSFGEFKLCVKNQQNQRVEVIAFGYQLPPVQNLYSAVIDPVGGYAYFAGSRKCASLQDSNPVVYNSSCDIGAASSASLMDLKPTADIRPFCAFGEFEVDPATVTVPVFQPLSKTDVGNDALLSGFIDKPRGRAYFGGTRFPLSDEVFDPLFAPGRVAQVDINPSSFVFISSITLNPSFSCPGGICSIRPDAENILSSVAFDPTNGTAYFGTGATPSRIVKVRIFAPSISVPPPNLAAEALGVSSLKWTFSGLGSAESYRFYPSTGGPPIVLSTTTTELIQVGLSTNTAYSARISAVNSAGEGPLSTLATRYTLAASATSFALLSTNLNSARVSWAANENPSYTLWEAGWWVEGGSTKSVTVQGTSVLLKGLAVDTTVYMSVRAVNGNGIPSAYDVAASTKITGVSVETATPDAEKTVTFQEATRQFRVRVPAGAFRQAVQVAAAVPAASNIPPPTGNLRALTRRVALEVLLDVDIQPLRDVEISLSYEDADIAGLDPDKLVVARYDENHSAWVPLYSVRDAAAKTVTAGTDHLSLFQIMQSDPSSGGLSGVTIGPNPYRPRKNPGQVMTFRNLPAGTKIKIYTYLGELVREVTEDGTGNAAWDGKNDSGKEAASGVYMGLIDASGAKKTLHLAVER